MSTPPRQMMQSGNNLNSDHRGPSWTAVACRYLAVVLCYATFAVVAVLHSLAAAFCDDGGGGPRFIPNGTDLDGLPMKQSTDERLISLNDLVSQEPVAARLLNLPATPYVYNISNLPAHFNSLPEEYRAIADSVIVRDAVATLGRVLFYDRSLSKSGTISCASCHQQKAAFSDPRRFSVGHDGRKTNRQSMSLINLKYSLGKSFFWDERAKGLKQQVLIPIENEVEMGHALRDLIPQLQADPIYPPLFNSAFGTAKVSRSRIAAALSEFVFSIVSCRSEFDTGMAHADSVLDDFSNFSVQQNRGKRQFFESGCAACHLSQGTQAGLGSQVQLNAAAFDSNGSILQSAIFQIEKAVVNGIDSDDRLNDVGVGQITGVEEDGGAFRSPSLRNVEVTGPYMHDGRFRTLDRVVEHYNWSVQPHPNLDPRLQFAIEGIAIPELQKVALVEFLKTLTDHELLADPKFGDPFVRQ